MDLAASLLRPGDAWKALFSKGFWILTAILANRRTP